MNRRDLLAGLLAMQPALTSIGFSCGRAWGNAPPVDVIKKFGFVADGRSDNFPAFQRWAAHVNQVGGGNYVFPPGTYCVTRYRTRYLSNLDPRQGVRALIEGAASLKISGHGAKIRLNGAFHRSGTPMPGLPAGAELATFIPFEISGSRNVLIQGFEIDGGVREMTRDGSVVESYAALVALHGCTNVLIEDLDVHHCQTDGIYISSSFGRGRPRVSCRNVALNRVRSRNNARGGLGVIQVLGLTCTDCSFNDNGRGTGKYLPHPPQFGVDIEPDYYASGDVDVRTGDIEFQRCEFSGNGSAFLAAYPARYRGYLRLIDCRSDNAAGAQYHMIMSWPGALLEGGLHDIGEGTFFLSWEEPGSEVTLRNAEFRTCGTYGLFHPHPGNVVQIQSVRIIGTHRVASSHGFVVAIQGDPRGSRYNLIRDCEIFVPSARKSRISPYDYEVSFHHTVSENNLFRTDLPGKEGQHFCTDYGSGTLARRDRYQGTAPGHRDSFRPAHDAAHDSRNPYWKF